VYETESDITLDALIEEFERLCIHRQAMIRRQFPIVSGNALISEIKFRKIRRVVDRHFDRNKLCLCEQAGEAVCMLYLNVLNRL
jgi:hypothetical protein